jgi:sortase (surface protein transpeptidase)
MSILHRILHQRSQAARASLAIVLLLSLAACQGGVLPATSAATPALTPSANATPVSLSEAEISEVDPLALDQTTGPVRLQIPAIELDVPVIAMGWRVDMVDGTRTTVWDVPQEEAGWHINSAGAGGAGNTIISGRQVGGAAVFAPLALGTVAAGQEVFLTDGDGIMFVYRIREVTAPVPVTGATPEEAAAAAAFFAPADAAQLTLVTGWPEFTTTHRVFAVADFVGVAQ